MVKTIIIISLFGHKTLTIEDTSGEVPGFRAARASGWPSFDFSHIIYFHMNCLMHIGNLHKQFNVSIQHDSKKIKQKQVILLKINLLHKMIPEHSHDKTT